MTRERLSPERRLEIRREAGYRGGKARWGNLTTEERFWQKVARADDSTACWPWIGQTSEGYGRFKIGRFLQAHRVAYEMLVGPIAPGLQLDHRCRNRACVNPAHLEPVTPRENVLRSPVAPAARNARKTHCPKGHEYTPENTYRTRKGRYCRACRKAFQLAAGLVGGADKRARHLEDREVAA